MAIKMSQCTCPRGAGLQETLGLLATDPNCPEHGGLKIETPKPRPQGKPRCICKDQRRNPDCLVHGLKLLAERVMKMIREWEASKPTQPVPYEHFYEAMKAEGISADDIMEAVNILLDHGKIYEPDLGHVRSI